MKLYPYQEKIFSSVMETYKKTNKLMMVVPTGGGKTVIFSHIIKSLGCKALIVAHTKELIQQANKTLSIIGCKDCHVSTIQGASKSLDSFNDYDMLVIDECHRAASPSYLKLIEKFNKKRLLGVTATPFRSDGQWLSQIFGTKISPLSLIEMINMKLLSDFEGYRVYTGTKLKGISTKDGDFISSKLASVINVKNRNELIVREYLKIAKGEKTLCFAANIPHCDELAHEFNQNGISARSIHGKIGDGQRKFILQAFKEGEIKVLTSCQILTEGFDEPSITCLLMARPTISKTLYLQMLGRGSRIYPGKKVCKVIEFTDNEYDVSNLEEVILSRKTNRRFIDGERASHYEKRAKEFLEETQEVTVEKYEPIRTIDLKKASSWQKSFLKKLGIHFSDDISELEANRLIMVKTNA